MRTALAILLALLPAVASAEDFPQVFSHMYGETVVDKPPMRIVSLGYVSHDHLLALGVAPVALRYWYGPFPSGVWPWAAPYLQGTEPLTLRGELSMERIAMQEPDLIIAISSGISAQDYRILSRIAPTIASEAQYGDYNTPWDVQAQTIGRAIGHAEEARTRIAAINQRFADLRAAHPEWGGMTGVAAALTGAEPAAFLPGDARADILAGLGFQVPAKLRAHAGESFYLPLSSEDLSPLDADLVYWIGGSDTGAALNGLTLRPTMRAMKEGREAWADTIMAGAMGHATLLSLPYVLDHILPEITAAVDGDPATVVPSAHAAGIAP